MAPDSVLRECTRLGIDRIFVTDHDTVEGALRLQERAGPRVVVGEEITTADGELIGLFLTQRVPSGLPAVETVDRIKAQRGLVYLQHPYDTRRRCLSEPAIERIAERIDIVEVFNPRSDESANARASELRDTLGTAAGAGSDAHRIGEIGAAFIEVPDFSDAASFLRGLASSRIVTRPKRSVLRLRALLEGRW